MTHSVLSNHLMTRERKRFATVRNVHNCYTIQFRKERDGEGEGHARIYIVVQDLGEEVWTDDLIIRLN